MYYFGNRIKELRLRRKLTQKELAERINKSKAAISSYESDNQVPPVDVLISIANVLNTSLDDLVGFDKSHCYSANGLSVQQVKILDALFAEFKKPTNRGNELSEQQIKIIQALILLFSE
jgi:transcriptional regulator with XRE-family HTH domain